MVHWQMLTIQVVVIIMGLWVVRFSVTIFMIVILVVAIVSIILLLPRVAAIVVAIRVMVVLIITISLVKLFLLPGIFVRISAAFHFSTRLPMIEIKAEALLFSMLGALVFLVRVLRLHLEDKVAVCSVSILWVEHTGVGFEASSSLMPLTAIESIEIVAPVELEFVVPLIVSEDFNVVVEDEPWHIDWVEACAPGVERGGPEVHAKALCLVQMSDCWVVQINMAHLVSIYGPGDVVWGPFHLVYVPVVMRVKPVSVVMRFNLFLAIPIDDIHGEWIVLNRRDDLHVELVPLVGLEVGAIPVGEEGRYGALSIWGLHTRDKLTVLELLIG